MRSLYLVDNVHVTRSVTGWEAGTMWHAVITRSMHSGWVNVDGRVCACYEGLSTVILLALKPILFRSFTANVVLAQNGLFHVLMCYMKLLTYCIFWAIAKLHCFVV